MENAAFKTRTTPQSRGSVKWWLAPTKTVWLKNSLFSFLTANDRHYTLSNNQKIIELLRLDLWDYQVQLSTEHHHHAHQLPAFFTVTRKKNNFTVTPFSTVRSTTALFSQKGIFLGVQEERNGWLSCLLSMLVCSPLKLSMAWKALHIIKDTVTVLLVTHYLHYLHF